jgi:alpha-1,2-mannosyltransferase
VRALLRPLLWPLVVVLLSITAYAVLRHKRTELVDFEVYRRAATRALAAEPLYRPEDGHYVFKYLPAFALVMAPFALPGKEQDEAIWFALSVLLLAIFIRLSLGALPDRRRSRQALVWLGLLLTAKFWVKELAFGQTNLLLGILLVGAVIAADQGRRWLAAVLVGLGVFVKPYAIVMVPWLVWSQGWAAAALFAGVLGVGLVLPAIVYGWTANLDLISAWYRMVTETTAPNLMLPENISLATMWAKWIGPGQPASMLALATAAAAGLVVVAIALRRRKVKDPDYLELGVFMLLVPLISPQGWDYVLLLALPALLCLVDRWQDMSLPWRTATALGFILTSFTVFDLMGRFVYTHLMALSAVTVGALILIVSLANLRWRQFA